MSTWTTSKDGLRQAMTRLGRLTGIAQSHRAARDFADLQGLSDRELRDIGLWREPSGSERRHLLRF